MTASAAAARWHLAGATGAVRWPLAGAAAPSKRTPDATLSSLRPNSTVQEDMSHLASSQPATCGQNNCMHDTVVLAMAMG